MSKLKVMTVIGTRPEIIKLSRVINELDKFFDQILVHTGQNYDYELNQIFFEDLGVRQPDYFLNAVGNTTAETIGNIISQTDNLIAKEKPDGFLIYGDTNSCLSVISAKRRQVPIFHMEAGNRSFDQRVPEEINRKIVDHLSDINLPLTDQAKSYLIQEGLKPDKVIKIGSCMKEVLTFHKEKIDKSNVLSNLGLDKNSYFVVSIHREENVDYPDNLISLINDIKKLTQYYKIPAIISTHPRTRKRLEDLDLIKKEDKYLKFLKPLGFSDYIHLQMKARCVLSDSGTITEEASILQFPSVMIRNAHERPEGMDEGVTIMSSVGKNQIMNSVKMVCDQMKDSEGCTRIVKDYDVDNVSVKVARIIQSYVSFVDDYVWKKNISRKNFYNV